MRTLRIAVPLGEGKAKSSPLAQRLDKCFRTIAGQYGMEPFPIKHIVREGRIEQRIAQPDEVAGILFTSGSTGVPKGVVYRHRHFVAQIDMLRQAFGMRPGGVDLPTFPPFALFDPALGLTSVIPDMDPTRPASADPRKLHAAIRQFGVTQLFGSPALMRVLADHGVALPTVRRVTSAGGWSTPAARRTSASSTVN